MRGRGRSDGKKLKIVEKLLEMKNSKGKFFLVHPNS